MILAIVPTSLVSSSKDDKTSSSFEKIFTHTLIISFSAFLESKSQATTVSRQSPTANKRADNAPSSARTNDTKKSTKTDEQKSKAAKAEEPKATKAEEPKATKAEEPKATSKSESPDKSKTSQAASPTKQPTSDSSRFITTQRSSFDLSSFIETNYTVITQTGSATGSGTDANVYISLFGDKDKIARKQLKLGTVGWDPFEQGHKDEFLFDGDDIGKVRVDFSSFFPFNS